MAEGMWAKMKDYLGFGPEEDDYDEELEDAAEETKGSALRELNRPVGSKSPGGGLRSERGRVTSLTDLRTNPPRFDLNDRQASPAAPANSGSFKLVAIQPKAFEEAQPAADHLRGRRPIILNVEGLDKDTVSRILHFLHGVIYVLGGDAQRLTTHIYVFAPQGVDLDKIGPGWPADKQDKAEKVEKTDKQAKTAPTLFKSLND